MREIFKGELGGRYIVRDTRADENAHVAVLIENDPDHRGKVQPETFTEPQVGTQLLACEDGGEFPIFYLRISRVMRVDIQFDMRAMPERIQAALLDGFPWLIRKAKGAGFYQMIFDSTTRALITFCKRRFGFANSPNELVCPLTSAKQSKPQGINENHVPQVSSETVAPDWREGR